MLEALRPRLPCASDARMAFEKLSDQSIPFLHGRVEITRAVATHIPMLLGFRV